MTDYDPIFPTPERLRKGDAFDHPHVDQRTNRKAHRVLDPFQELLRDGKIQVVHNEAAQKFICHYQGRERYDVRISDALSEGGGSDIPGMPPWQYHGEKIAEARSTLLPDEFRAVELLAARQDTVRGIGYRLSGSKNRDNAMGCGLRTVVTALERLAILWGLKRVGT